MNTRKVSRALADKVRKNSSLSERQAQLCLGGLLGDSSITIRNGHRCRIRFYHGEKQRDYLEWKRSIMDKFIVQTTPTISISQGYDGGRPGYLYETITHQDFEPICDLFYREIGGKKTKYITYGSVKEIGPLGLLFWYLDDGTITTRKDKGITIRLATYNFTLPEHRMLKKFFWKNFRLRAVIQYDKTHNLYYLRFNTEDTRSFLQILSPFRGEVPSCMQYKLPNL